MKLLRRHFLAGTSVLAWAPAALWLGTRSANLSAATAATAKSSLQVQAVSGSALEPGFADSAGGRFITPPPLAIQAVVDGTVLRLSITDSALSNGVFRNVALTLTGNAAPAKGMAYTVGGSTLSVGDGTVSVNRLTSADHHDFTLAPARLSSQGRVTIADLQFAKDPVSGAVRGRVVLTFSNVRFDPTPAAQVMNNLATRSLLLSGTVEVACVEESSAGWLA